MSDKWLQRKQKEKRLTEHWCLLCTFCCNCNILSSSSAMSPAGTGLKIHSLPKWPSRLGSFRRRCVWYQFKSFGYHEHVHTQTHLSGSLLLYFFDRTIMSSAILKHNSAFQALHINDDWSLKNSTVFLCQCNPLLSFGDISLNTRHYFQSFSMDVIFTDCNWHYVVLSCLA